MIVGVPAFDAVYDGSTSVVYTPYVVPAVALISEPERQYKTAP